MISCLPSEFCSTPTSNVLSLLLHRCCQAGAFEASNLVRRLRSFRQLHRIRVSDSQPNLSESSLGYYLAKTLSLLLLFSVLGLIATQILVTSDISPQGMRDP